MHPKVVLIGMPASGKSRVSRRLCEILTCEAHDLDHIIEAEQGTTVADIFKQNSKEYFRNLEAVTLKQQLTEFDGVLSLGGGTLTTEVARDLLETYRINGGVVVYLDVHEVIAFERIVRKKTRPLLENDAENTWLHLRDERRVHFEHFADITIRVGSADGSFTESDVVASRIAAELDAKFVRVTHKDSCTYKLDAQLVGLNSAENLMQNSRESISYTMHIGRDLTPQIPCKFPSSVRKIFLVHQPTVSEHAANIAEELQLAGFEVLVKVVPDAENGKTMQMYEQCLEQMAAFKMTRTDAICGIGGGACTDLAGFLGATFDRGIKYVNVPTSLLAAVDASVGGKTGINLLAGKNLCGAFCEPHAVVVDLNALETLPRREFIEGLGEVAKIALTFDSLLLDILQDVDISEGENSGGSLLKDSCVVSQMVEKSVQVKADVVSKDLKDTGLREFLNYGHTLGHAIEKLENYQVRHGEAVAIGMVFAAHLAHILGMIDQSVVKLHVDLLRKLNLPTSWKTECTFEDVLEVMRVDKKTQGDTIRFVLLEELQKPVVVKPEISVLKKCFNLICE